MSGPERDLSEDIAFFLTASAILEAAESRHIARDGNPRRFALPLEEEGEAEDLPYADLVSDAMIEAAFREQGEEDIADLYLGDRKEFWSRFERGREALMRPRRQDERPRGED
jgi:hypothetical protein